MLFFLRKKDGVNVLKDKILVALKTYEEQDNYKKGYNNTPFV
jgi:hypothetical protein